MRAPVLLLLALATAVAQVAIAPFFPLLGAVVELPVILLVVLAIFAGPRAVMIVLPILVLFLGFSTNVEFEWLIAAYLPILPCAAWIQRQRAIPQTPYVLALGMTLAAGIWARGVFAAVAMAAGASPDIGGAVADVLLPGAALDAVVLSLAYAVCRWVGWPVRSLDLQRADF